ncbi:hypothetical protein QTP86_007664 [Hemibagrus guttatus]|nr:hypothetical protein QTP86_007664 [Hemibagrus guttatus]
MALTVVRGSPKALEIQIDRSKLKMAPGCFSVCSWFVLVCVIPGIKSCLQCDLAIRHMHDDFMATKQKLTVQEQIDLKKILTHAYVTYQDTSTQLSGVIGSIQWDMIKILEKGKRILKKHLEVFVAEAHHLLAKEGEQVVLDCFLPWHTLVVGHAEYYYSWKRGATKFSAEDEFEILVVTKDSKIVLNQLSVSEQGVYRCFLLDQHGTTLSHTHFMLIVTPMPTSPPRQIPTLPSLPHVDVKHVQVHKDTLIIALALLAVLSISGSLAIILHIVSVKARVNNNCHRHHCHRRRVRRQREKRKGKSVGLRIGTLNVGTMTGKGRELADMMERRKVDILCVQETRWKGSKARSIGAGFKLFYYGVDSKRNGVGVVLKEEFVRNVLEVKRVSDRVMSLKLEIEGVMLNVVSGYAPQVGCELEEKERFWSELDEVMESTPTGERVVIGADFNGHVGEGNRGDEEVMGKFGVKERKLEGQMVVDFAKRMDIAVADLFCQMTGNLQQK